MTPLSRAWVHPTRSFHEPGRPQEGHRNLERAQRLLQQFSLGEQIGLRYLRADRRQAVRLLRTGPLDRLFDRPITESTSICPATSNLRLSGGQKAIERARPEKVVCLSTIGAQVTQPNLLTQRKLLEEALRTLQIPVTFLRPAWFMENFALGCHPSARQRRHRIVSPAPDKPVPRSQQRILAVWPAQLIGEDWEGVRIVRAGGSPALHAK